MGPRLGWTHFAHKKGMGSPCLRLTLTQHAIFVEKTGPRGGCVRRGRWTRFACKKSIGFTQFKHDSHTPSNFCQKNTYVPRADVSERWVGLLRLQKRIGSPSFRLTLTHHAIYIKKTGPSGGCVRGVVKQASLAKNNQIHLVYI